MKFAIVTTCMGRAEHVKVSLPMMLAQDHPDFDVFVVDWDSKDDLQQVVKDNMCGELHYVEKQEQEHFHLSAARNLGARCAVYHAAPQWIAFIDADILLPPDFLKRNQHCFELLHGVGKYDVFLQSQRTSDGDVQMWGSCIVRTADWYDAQYNEQLQGYGFEDNEFYELLEKQGALRCSMDVTGVTAIKHPEEMRFANYPEQTEPSDYGRDLC